MAEEQQKTEEQMVQENANETLFDEEFRKKIKTKFVENVLNGNQFKLILNLFLPQFGGYAIESFCSYLSAYFQARYFGSIYYTATIYQLPILQIFSKFLPAAIAQMHAINIQTKLQLNETAQLQDIQNNHFRIQLLCGLICSIVGLVVSFSIKSFPAFDVCFRTCCFFQPICTALSTAYITIYVLENRRLITFTLTTMRPIMQLFIELFIYQFFPIVLGMSEEEEEGLSKLTSNYPTTIAVVLSYLIIVLWISQMEFGKSALGVINLKEMPINKEVFNFKKFGTKIFWKQFGNYMISMLSVITNFTFPIAVYFCVSVISQVYTQSISIAQMDYKIFVFFYFGTIFRTASSSLNGMYTVIAIHNLLAKNQKRMNITLIVVIIVSIFMNVLLYLFFSFTPICQLFSIDEFQDIDVSQTLMWAAIAGFGQTLTELVVTQNIIYKSYVTLIVLPIFKLVELFVGVEYLKSTIGDEADFVLVLFFTELNSSGCSFVMIIIDIVKNAIKNKKTGKKKHSSEAKKQTLDEQLAALK